MEEFNHFFNRKAFTYNDSFNKNIFNGGLKQNSIRTNMGSLPLFFRMFFLLVYHSYAIIKLTQVSSVVTRDLL